MSQHPGCIFWLAWQIPSLQNGITEAGALATLHCVAIPRTADLAAACSSSETNVDAGCVSATIHHAVDGGVALNAANSTVPKILAVGLGERPAYWKQRCSLRLDGLLQSHRFFLSLLTSLRSLEHRVALDHVSARWFFSQILRSFRRRLRVSSHSFLQISHFIVFCFFLLSDLVSEYSKLHKKVPLVQFRPL